MTNDKGPATAGAPTPDEVENALARLESYSNGLGDGCCSTIRAHIAALEEQIDCMTKHQAGADEKRCRFNSLSAAVAALPTPPKED